MSDTGKIDSLDKKSQATEKLKQRLEEMGVMPSEGKTVSKTRTSGIGIWNSLLILALIAVVGYVLVSNNLDKSVSESIATDNKANLKPVGSAVTEEIKTDVTATDDGASSEENTLLAESNPKPADITSSSNLSPVESSAELDVTEIAELKVPVDDQAPIETTSEIAAADNATPVDQPPLQNNSDDIIDSLASTAVLESAVDEAGEAQGTNQSSSAPSSGSKLATSAIPHRTLLNQPANRWLQYPRSQFRHPQMLRDPMARGLGYPSRYWQPQIRPSISFPNPRGKVTTHTNPLNSKRQWGEWGAGYYPQPGSYYPAYPYYPRRW